MDTQSVGLLDQYKALIADPALFAAALSSFVSSAHKSTPAPSNLHALLGLLDMVFDMLAALGCSNIQSVYKAVKRHASYILGTPYQVLERRVSSYSILLRRDVFHTTTEGRTPPDPPYC
jgi:hypothetical protein